MLIFTSGPGRAINNTIHLPHEPAVPPCGCVDVVTVQAAVWSGGRVVATTDGLLAGLAGWQGITGAQRS